MKLPSEREILHSTDLNRLLAEQTVVSILAKICSRFRTADQLLTCLLACLLGCLVEWTWDLIIVGRSSLTPFLVLLREKGIRMPEERRGEGVCRKAKGRVGGGW